MTTAHHSQRRQAVETLERGLSILDAVRAQGMTTVHQLATTVDLPLSTVYRYVRYLREAGYLAEMDNRYVCGPRSISGGSRRETAHLVEIAGPPLRQLQRATRATAILTVRVQLAALTLERVLPESGSALSFRRGQLRPLYAGASATTLLAWATEDVIDQVAKGTIKKITASTPSGPALLRELASIRRHGYAVSHGEVDPLMSGIGAPVLRGGRCVCAVSAAGPTGQVADGHLQDTVDAVREAASLVQQGLPRSAGQAWDGAAEIGAVERDAS